MKTNLLNPFQGLYDGSLPSLPTCNLTVSSAIQLKQQKDEHKCSGVKIVIKLHIYIYYIYINKTIYNYI